MFQIPLIKLHKWKAVQTCVKVQCFSRVSFIIFVYTFFAHVHFFYNLDLSDYPSTVVQTKTHMQKRSKSAAM